MRHLALTVVFFFLVSVASASPNDPGSQDQTFLQHATQGGMFAVELGKLATEKATRPEVKTFGSRMMKDHQETITKLEQLASTKKIEILQELAPEYQSLLTKLKKLSEKKFDQAYIAHSVSDHRRDIKIFEKQAQKGTDEELRQFAQNTLPILREHLSHAEETNKTLE